eukprot:4803678-Pyramimonas_sp.AAC.1
MALVGNEVLEMFPNTGGILLQECKLLGGVVGDAMLRLHHQGWNCRLPSARKGAGRSASSGPAVGAREDIASTVPPDLAQQEHRDLPSHQRIHEDCEYACGTGDLQ